MPELPEVETIVRQLKKRGVEQREILAVRIDWPKMIAPTLIPYFQKKFAMKRLLNFLEMENGLYLN